MAPFATIYSYPNNPRVWRALTIAKLNGLEVVEGPFQMGVTNKTPEFLAKFPMGKIPALETADGFCIAESSAIAYYLAELGPKKDYILGNDAQSRALVHQWLSFADNELHAVINTILYMFLGITPFDESLWDQKVAALARPLKRLELALEKTQFLISDHCTFADLSVSIPMQLAYTMFFDAQMRKTYPAVVKWYSRVMESEGVKGVWGPVELLEVAKKPVKK